MRSPTSDRVIRPPPSGRARLLVPAAALACALLAPVGLGLVPFLRYAWGFTLWQYLPRPIAWLLAAALLALCLPAPRALLLAAARAALAALDREVLRRAVVAIPAVALLLWLLRERMLFGDSRILLYNAASGSAFLFPDVGATFLFQLAQRIARALGTRGIEVVQAFVCVAGAGAVYCLARAAGALAPARGRAVLVAALLLSGGTTRIFAGHVEVYAFVLLCAGAYLWAALTHLEGRCGLTAPALAFGMGLWMHLSFAFLLPSLLALVALGPQRAAPSSAAALARNAVGAAALAALPTLLFFAALYAAGRHADLAQALRTLVDWGGLEREPGPHHVEVFVRPFWASPGPGTQFVILSAPHLKYLANAFFVLAPAALPVLAAFAALAPRRLLSTRPAVFLAAASAPLLGYALIVRPVWGPYDWDLFSLTAICVSAFAAHLLAVSLDDATLTRLGVVLVGTGLLAVLVPFVWIGLGPSRAAGPFANDAMLPAGDETVWEAFERQMEPWL